MPAARFVASCTDAAAIEGLRIRATSWIHASISRPKGLGIMPLGVIGLQARADRPMSAGKRSSSPHHRAVNLRHDLSPRSGLPSRSQFNGAFRNSHKSLLGAPNKTSREPVNNERRTAFGGGSCRACACRREEPQRHRGHGEGVRPLPPCPLCLRGSSVLTKTWFCQAF